MKHGLYAEGCLLPGEDEVEFQRRRRALFHTYRPQTQDEADLVEFLAECRWQWLRCRPWQGRFDTQTRETPSDAAGRLAEPVGHKRLHSSMDVTVHRQRIDRIWHRMHTKLVSVQKLRRMGLIEGAVKLPPGCYMDT